MTSAHGKPIRNRHFERLPFRLLNLFDWLIEKRLLRSANNFYLNNSQQHEISHFLAPLFSCLAFFGYRVFQNSPLKTCPTPFVLESASTLFIPCPLLSRLFLFPSFLSSSASWHSSVRDLKSRLCKTAVRYRVACQNAVQASILQMASQENVSASSQPGRNISLFFFPSPTPLSYRFCVSVSLFDLFVKYCPFPLLFLARNLA